MMNQQHAADAARQFLGEGQILAVTAYGSGHINDTFSVDFLECNKRARFILQRINTGIFKDTAALMQNIERVTAHLAHKLRDDPGRDRRVLRLIPARDGRSWYRDGEGNDWRAYRFIEGARTCDRVESAAQAYQAAKAFGQFQSMLADLPAPRLNDSIPDFHNTPKRFKAFEQALNADAANRAALAGPEIEFAFARQSIAQVLLGANLPERVTHNDTKFNNVLFDDVSGEGICVLDLDTVMSGLSLYDFGDMVRTATSAADEDERDLSKVRMEFPMFDALLRGYLSTAGGILSPVEIENLVCAGKLITFEQGIRFLADYLAGDSYYKVQREGQNLDRCRTQFKLIQSIEEQEERMMRLVSEAMNEQGS
ncbi:MAG: aminoglycoside phosphotransferase family protein [Terracidiphilus sp.]|jgi:thiamine kinase-like enzyme